LVMVKTKYLDLVNFTKEQVEQFVGAYNAGETYQQLAQGLGSSKGQARALARQLRKLKKLQKRPSDTELLLKDIPDAS